MPSDPCSSITRRAARIRQTNPWGAATFMQIFFLATGLHGLHVILGLMLMAWLLLTGTETNEARLESVALYWHFVDFVWIFILSTLYFL